MRLWQVLVEGENGAVLKYISLVAPDFNADRGLPREAILGRLPAEATLHEVSAFRPNPSCIDFLQATIAKHIVDAPPWQGAARAQGEGWIYLIDFRTADPQGDVPSEDIIGRVAARASRLVPGSYQGNPNHRLLTERGPFQLDAWLARRLADELAMLTSGPSAAPPPITG
jgi:hypothetical protein